MLHVKCLQTVIPAVCCNLAPCVMQVLHATADSSYEGQQTVQRVSRSAGSQESTSQQMRSDSHAKKRSPDYFGACSWYTRGKVSHILQQQQQQQQQLVPSVHQSCQVLTVQHYSQIPARCAPNPSLNSHPGIICAHHRHDQQQQQLLQRQRQQWQQRRALHLAPPFLVEDYVPVAVATYRSGKIPAKLKAAEQELEHCKACPRDCGVNRLKEELGLCQVGRKLLVSTVAPHFAEEAPLQGWNGSGTVFFSMCNMRCVFCQNWDISQKRAGFELTGAELADWMLKLQDLGNCHNINFVTPEHVAPQVVEAIATAVEKGLTVPIIYNTSSYDGLSSLALMDGLVDIYMPDFKFWSEESSRKYMKARDYPQHAKAAIKEMHRQVGDLVFSPDGLAKRGVLLRHLVMPGLLDESKAILNWVVKEIGRDTYVHLMEQYSPRHLVGTGEQRSRFGFVKYDEIDRQVTSAEMLELRDYARNIGLWRFEEAPRYEATELAG